MSDKCPKCGAPQSVVGHWFGPIMLHQENGEDCLRSQLAAVVAERDRLKEAANWVNARITLMMNNPKMVFDVSLMRDKLRAALGEGETP